MRRCEMIDRAANRHHVQVLLAGVWVDAILRGWSGNRARVELAPKRQRTVPQAAVRLPEAP